MRVLLAPSAFSGTLTAPEAAAAMAEGWRSVAPDTEIDLAPVSSGGVGFLETVAASAGGETEVVGVRGPLADAVPAAVLRVGDVAYVEAAQAAGRHLVPSGDDPGLVERASSAGVGELIAAAVDQGAREVVVGLGGLGCNDGGAGLLAALGARVDAGLDAGLDVALDGGVSGLAGLPEAPGASGAIDLAAARARVDGVRLVAACDLMAPLTGLFGTTKAAGAERGLPEHRVPAVDGVLERWAHAAGRRVALDPGAGAGGGAGYALLLLGAEARPAVEVVAERLDLAGRAARADLVVTGEGRFDHTSRAGKAPHGVAAAASAALRPCVVVAGEVLVGQREMRALGVDAAYASSDELPGGDRHDAYAALVRAAARVARTWAP